ncbi:hypothetical protein GWK47_005938 [Chionoecetes opilio]|uniref:Uncharacterized protein n=1 Tax=Chionoecetes opilio TaxID=41210 RepID=A0A8J4YG39_CHIOP|nr:hypothetical protein GWK47_005938 [Chionoecetes opilio]
MGHGRWVNRGEMMTPRCSISNRMARWGPPLASFVAQTPICRARDFLFFASYSFEHEGGRPEGGCVQEHEGTRGLEGRKGTHKEGIKEGQPISRPTSPLLSRYNTMIILAGLHIHQLYSAPALRFKCGKWRSFKTDPKKTLAQGKLCHGRVWHRELQAVRAGRGRGRGTGEETCTPGPSWTFQDNVPPSPDMFHGAQADLVDLFIRYKNSSALLSGGRAAVQHGLRRHEAEGIESKRARTSRSWCSSRET